MSGPIVRSYGVPNWDEIFGGDSGSKTSTGGKKKAKKSAGKAKAAKKKTAKKTKR